ncbi:MAG: RHS repeat domain-containing protein, partial [Lysobacterales bacterium]
PAGSSGLPLTRVHRHTRTEYDSQGRYPVRTLSPHFDGTPDGALYALETVQSRDALGNVMQTNRLNGGSATATYGPLGRQQTSEDSTGAKTVSEFHWCVGNGISGQVAACPSDLGAVFRQTAYTYGGTRSVTYFDRLGREVFALSESFNRYDENAANDWVGVCKTYDGRGRTVAVTEPFFVGNVATSGLRPELSTAVGCASKPSTRTTYDVLDRALTIRLPEDIGGTTVARTEMEYQGLSTTTRTYLSRATTPFATPTVVTLSEVKLHDPTGLVLTVTDAEGLEAKYAHDAAGNLVALKRNAGNGDIVSRIGYDALGRKISQNDPDAGTASYAYNAAGELICSQDARGYATITDFDALGRSWRSRSLRSSCASNTTAAITVSNADASILPSATTGDHSSVDLTVYDLAANGVGQIESTLRRHRVGSTYAGYRGVSADQGEFQQTSAYDSFGRPSQVSTRFREPNLGSTGLVERSFTQRTTYDALGRVATTQDATGGVVENMYSAHGFLRRVRDAGQPSLVFWELLETDVRGQTTLDRRHGKVELTQQRQYNEVTGRLARIITGTWSNNQIHSAVQNLSYVFDAQGNLLSRKDERANGREEVFVYDRLNRLIEARLSGASPSPADGLPTLTLSYDKLGNICSKNGVGYTYAGRSGCGLNGLSGGGSNSGASPHAVTARGAQAYQYDAAGNMTRTTGHNAGPGFTSTVRDVRFDGAGNADRLSISDQSTSFWYAGGGRYLRLDESSDAPAKLTRYLGGVEWILRGGGAEERRRSIGGFLLLTESVTAQQPTPTRKYRYLLADHLGSTDTLVDENGVVVERMSFDAHGSRRAAASGTGMWASLLPAVAPTEINPQVNAETTRGFTGHEHVDRMGLIHMNGRLYDPLLGRMLSPDPIVQEPYNAQNLNRYSYVLNNPLSYTDP